jgi:ribonuclease E
MLIDATHPEETRVVVHSGTRLEEFDYETVSKKQLKGNIYLAKITRVEPSLQAAFVEYGGNRHGFLPFSEIHPDYYRIPIADREALLAEEKALKSSSRNNRDTANGHDADESDTNGDTAVSERAADTVAQDAEAASDDDEVPVEQDYTVEEIEGETSVDTLSGDDEDEAVERSRASLLRRYKIQEVIKRRQVILVQISKEERGNKGAALTTYLSLAGRYCVLMPNTNKGGGISRKISNTGDRRRLKEILGELNIPEGIAVIVRTAGSERNKTEIRRDYEYLMRLWNDIRETTLSSTAPALIHEEANLIKRAIRDLYSRDMEDVLVEGEAGYKAAKNFMRTLMPSHAKKVQLYKDPSIPLFQRYKVEGQIDAMHNPTVQLKSGGYIVINPTEALVAIDVNSGKATRERHIESTALKTNLEAADEVARQVRLRDLAGLVVVDFIDMEESRHNRDVERRIKEAMKNDRARIQLGRISPFGLLEMSRQRLRPSLVENSTLICPVCQGVGTVRTTESTVLHVLRAVEEEGIRRANCKLLVKVPSAVAFYMLNQKRARLLEIEQRYGFDIEIVADAGLLAPDYSLERFDESTDRIGDQRPDRSIERSRERVRERPAPKIVDDEVLHEDDGADQEDAGAEKKRSRRRRRRKREDEVPTTVLPANGNDQPMLEPETETETEADEDADIAAENVSQEDGVDGEDEEGKARKRRRRGKRGGRRRSRRREEGEGEGLDAEGASEEVSEDGTPAPLGEIAAAAAGDEAASEAVTAESVVSPEAVSEAAPEAGTAEADIVESETAGQAVDAEAEGDAPKPKRRRTRAPRRPKAEVADSGAPAAASDVASEETGAEAAPAATEETGAEAVKAAPKKRASRSRATAAPRAASSRARKPAAAKDNATVTPAPEKPVQQPRNTEVAADESDRETRKPEPAMAQEDGSQESSPPQFAPGAGREPDTGAVTTERHDDDESDDSEPKRRGWWSRWV